jgi:hypothetical protein
MEVCDLDECDFVETRFIEYIDRNSYINDTSDELFEDEDEIVFNNLCLSKDNKMKGEIIYFHTKDGKPFYAYKPLDVVHPSDIQEWEEKTIDYYQENPDFKYIYMKTLYWKLEEFSCVLVCRNKKWFKDNINELSEIWSIIEKERISGYDHRAPIRREKPKYENNMDKTVNNNGCLLQFNKETGKITVAKLDIEINI